MAGNQDNDRLFALEAQTLAASQKESLRPEYQGNPMLPAYKSLVDSYQRLLVFAKKAVRIGDTQGKVLKDRELKMENLLNNSNQGFLTFGKDFLVEDEYSAECERIFGRKIKKEPIASLLNEKPTAQQRYLDAFSSALNTGGESSLGQLPSRVPINGRVVDVSYRLLSREEGPAILVMLTDVTEKTQSEARVRYLSEHDSLTSLHNRAYVDKSLPHLLKEENLPLSIILADMNGLKLTNDVFGHQKGDELIVSMARILEKCCGERGIAARWGGDEFLVILPQQTEAGCQAVVQAINQACNDKDREFVHISVSIGTATMHDPHENITDLFASAENRMYKNKLAEAKTVRQNIIQKVEATLQAKGIVPMGHFDRLRKMVMDLAKEKDLIESPIDVKSLMLMVSLHDAGKIALPEDLLKKTGPLTSSEWKVLKTYTEIGYRLAQSIGEPMVAEAILGLRERWDGTGYPEGLAGSTIPRYSRLFAILESFDLMQVELPHKKGVDQQEALRQIDAASGKQFDPELTELFLTHYQASDLRYGMGG